jgi:hypothetical protein
MAMDILKGAIDKTNTTSCDGLNQASQEAVMFICESPLTVVPGLQGMPCYVYGHGMMIVRTTSEETSEGMLSLYSATVLFNKALTSHHEGRLGRDLSRKRASLFYNMTVQILNENVATGNISAAILTLLALNNKAQIHFDQCEYIQCVDFFRVEAVHSALSQKDHCPSLLPLFHSTASIRQALDDTSRPSRSTVLCDGLIDGSIYPHPSIVSLSRRTPGAPG